MSRILVLFFVVLLPLQFAWSAASAYCQHETNEVQAKHFGHHVHVHKGEAKKSSDSKLSADSDCASCHATSTPVITSKHDTSSFARLPTVVALATMPPFTSALARAPDRPQWLRLV